MPEEVGLSSFDLKSLSGAPFTNFNHSMEMPSKVWNEITYPFPNFCGEVCEWISILIPHFIMDVII